MINISCKKFLAAAAVSLIAIFNPSEPAACGWEPSYSASRYPAFLLTDTPVSYPRDSDVSYETVAFWEEYVGNRVNYSDIRDFSSTVISAAAAGMVLANKKQDSSRVSKFFFIVISFLAV